MPRQYKTLARQQKLLTGLLLVERQVMPAILHAVAQRHPQLSLLLHRHRLPSLLDVGERRVRNGVRRRRARRNGRRAAAAGTGAQERLRRRWDSKHDCSRLLQEPKMCEPDLTQLSAAKGKMASTCALLEQRPAQLSCC